ncbi:MAG: EamA family transporter RarD [Rhizobiales bacterium]|nr:EamA family transporter RarD [Hyphomicrobiales bacterium]
MSMLSEKATMHGLSESHKGIIACGLAHLVWGGMALYFWQIRDVSPGEIAANRGLWALPIAAMVLLAMGQFTSTWRLLANPKVVVTLAFTSFLIVFNWGVYVWTIEQHRTVESSLGYYINPLMNVIAGYLFLGERFSKAQLVAIALAAVAVAIQTVSAGVFPWIGILLGATFCLYGYIRKTVPVGPVQGFFIETLLIAGPALAYMVWIGQSGHAYFLTSAFYTLMLMGCGLMTATALLLFAVALKRIRYSTAGLMQYISPTLVFMTAVFVFHEPMDGWKLLSFVIIWIALAIYTISALREDRLRRQPLQDPSSA